MSGFTEGHESGFTEGHESGFTEGHESGYTQGMTDVAQTLIARGLPDAEIAEITKLNPDDVRKLRNPQ